MVLEPDSADRLPSVTVRGVVPDDAVADVANAVYAK